MSSIELIIEERAANIGDDLFGESGLYILFGETDFVPYPGT